MGPVYWDRATSPEDTPSGKTKLIARIGTGQITAQVKLAAGAWHHMAIVRQANSFAFHGRAAIQAGARDLGNEGGRDLEEMEHHPQVKRLPCPANALPRPPAFSSSCPRP